MKIQEQILENPYLFREIWSAFTRLNIEDNPYNLRYRKKSHI